jgi:hypothetical protein
MVKKMMTVLQCIGLTTALCWLILMCMTSIILGFQLIDQYLLK